MSTHKPDPDPETALAIESTVPGPVPDDEITRATEEPDGLPDGVHQVNVVLTHRESGLTVRRMVVYDSERQVVRDTEIGLVGDREVYRRDFDGAKYVANELVLVRGLGEAMNLVEYANMVGHDEAGYKLGPGFREAIHDSAGLT